MDKLRAATTQKHQLSNPSCDNARLYVAQYQSVAYCLSPPHKYRDTRWLHRRLQRLNLTLCRSCVIVLLATHGAIRRESSFFSMK